MSPGKPGNEGQRIGRERSCITLSSTRKREYAMSRRRKVEEPAEQKGTIRGEEFSENESEANKR